MSVVLTGGTGLVGSAVLRALVASGHEVTALVRSESSAEQVRAAGADPRIGDLTDEAWLAEQFAASDGAIHTASPGDASSADFDAAVARAAVTAFAGTAKPYVHTGGVWVYGPGDGIDETTPLAPPQLTAWRKGVEDVVLDADLRAVVVVPGVVYAGPTDGLPALLTGADEQGSYHLIGDGSQHWTTVHADQLADLYVRAFDNGAARGYYLGVNDDHPSVAEVVRAAAGQHDVVSETAQQSADRLGALLAEALLLDQSASNAKARTELGWNPTGPSLVEVASAVRA